jgi:hypothetical protein
MTSNKQLTIHKRILNNIATLGLYDSTCKIRRKKLTSLLMAFWSAAVS